jgi:hypothetical protein
MLKTTGLRYIKNGRIKVRPFAISLKSTPIGEMTIPIDSPVIRAPKVVIITINHERLASIPVKTNIPNKTNNFNTELNNKSYKELTIIASLGKFNFTINGIAALNFNVGLLSASENTVQIVVPIITNAA